MLFVYNALKNVLKPSLGGKMKKANFFSIFATFFRISLLTIGGGYAMVPVLANGVEKKQWMDKDEFYTLLAKAQSIPGSVAFNLSVLVGGKIAGLKGSLAGGIGVILPPFFAIVLIGAILSTFSNSPFIVGFLKGAYGAVMGLIGGVLYKMISSKKWNLLEISVTLVGTFLLIVKSNYVLVIFSFIVLIVWLGEKKWKL